MSIEQRLAFVFRLCYVCLSRKLQSPGRSARCDVKVSKKVLCKHRNMARLYQNLSQGVLKSSKRSWHTNEWIQGALFHEYRSIYMKYIPWYKMSRGLRKANHHQIAHYDEVAAWFSATVVFLEQVVSLKTNS